MVFLLFLIFIRFHNGKGRDASRFAWGPQKCIEQCAAPLAHKDRALTAAVSG